MRHLRTLALAVSTALAGLSLPAQVQAYPIDCAILLCLAGGFPPSAECTAAKAEFIRRITPWPIEPPLQLWRCPMGMDAATAAFLGITPPQLGADGLTPEVRSYRDAIEIYHVSSYAEVRDRETHDTYIYERVTRGEYSKSGDFTWISGSYRNGPEWLAAATGGSRIPVIERYGKDNEHERIVGYENRRGKSFRGVIMRYRDYSGAYHTEFVTY